MRQRPGRVSSRSPAARKSVWCARGGAVYHDSAPVVRGTDIFEDSHVLLLARGRNAAQIFCALHCCSSRLGSLCSSMIILLASVAT
jgi:hypothetical protein